MKMNKIISLLYQLTRKLIDFKTIMSGDIGKVARRGKNKFIGRKIIRRFW